MIRVILKLLILSGLFLLAACGQGGNDSLQVTVNPKNPVLIPYGEMDLGDETVSSPYFTMNNVKLTWKGSDIAQIQSIIIKMKEIGSSQEQTCAFGGTDLSTAFGGNTQMAAPAAGASPTVATSTMLACGSLTVKNKDAHSFNIQGIVRVVASTINSSGETTGRAVALSYISIQ